MAYLLCSFAKSWWVCRLDSTGLLTPLGAHSHLDARSSTPVSLTSDNDPGLVYSFLIRPFWVKVIPFPLRAGGLCCISELERYVFLAKVIYVLIHFLLIKDLEYFYFAGRILPIKNCYDSLGKAN